MKTLNIYEEALRTAINNYKLYLAAQHGNLNIKLFDKRITRAQFRALERSLIKNHKEFQKEAILAIKTKPKASSMNHLK